MRRSSPMNASYSPAARPRLTPGIPAGGIAALAVTLAVIAGSAIFGVDGDDDPRVAFNAGFDGVNMQVGPAPRPPVPPIPPIPPVASLAPGAPLPPGLMVDEAEVARSVEEALRAVDWAEIERRVAEATRTLDVDALRREARRAAEAARIEAHRVREQAAALRDQTRASAVVTEGGGALAANFDARALRLVNLNGTVAIEVTRRNDVRLEVETNANGLRTSVADGRLTVVAAGEAAAPVEMRILLPEGADLDLVGLIGDLDIGGRALGALNLDLLRGSVSVGEARSASIKVLQSGDVSVAEVKGPLRVSLFGAADLAVERAGDTFLEIAGTGNVSLNRIDGLTLSIPGHADVRVERVDGPVNAAFMGAGSVAIADGQADPLRVAVTGAGEFRFDGRAHDPVVLADGNGRVHVARHTGKASVQNRGQGTAWVGD